MYIEKLKVNGQEFKIRDAEALHSGGSGLDLTDYVKNTDYPIPYESAGVVNVNPTAYGIGAYPNTGYLYIASATEAEIDAKTHARQPIVPNNLDYAVKKGLADSKLEWTDEEKAKARELLGTIEAKTSDRTSVYAVNNRGEQILVGTSPNAANNGMIPIYNKNGTINVGTPATSQQSVNKAYVDAQIANVASNIFVANPDTTWKEIDDAYNAGKYIFYAFEQWGITNVVPLCQKGSGGVFIFTHIRENKYLYTVKVNKDNTRGIGSTYVVDKLDFDALVARVEALEGK